MKVHAVFTISANKVWGFDYHKPGGFMSQRDVMQFEVKLRNASEYMYKQVNREKYNGANAQTCDQQRDYAIDKINCLMAVLPNFKPQMNGTSFDRLDCRDMLKVYQRQ